MSDSITLEIEGRRVQVGREFLELTPDEQNATVDEIAQSLGPKESGFERGMSQLNTGIAESAGGLVDFINPFDKPHALNPFPEGTGSAQTGLRNVMEVGGVKTTDEAPDGAFEGFMRGTGQAAGALPVVGGASQVLSRAPGLVGNIADDAGQAFSTGRGVLAELMAGGGAGTGSEMAEQAGAPEWVQQAAGLAGGMAAAAPAMGAYAPTVQLGKRGYGAAKKALMPYTKTGAKEVAKERMQTLAGGEDRARELGQRVSEGPNEFGLTPAQQTGDEMMLSLEQAAGMTDPNLGARLKARAADTNQMLQRSVTDLGGEVEDAQRFLWSLRQDVKNRMDAHLAWAQADARVKRKPARRDETQNSQIVAEEIRTAETNAKAEEKQLWDAVPSDTRVNYAGAKAVAQELIESTPWAQEGDIPGVLRRFSEIEGFQTVAEMHGLYSELRRVARSAMAGNDQNRNKARIANEVAEQILADMGARDASTEAGRAINRAREFSAQMHETFDRGTIGRLLKRTLDGDEQIDPQETLARSVGQSGVKGRVAQDQIATATQGAPRGREATADYITGEFDKAAFGADGTYKDKAAQEFLRSRKELLDRFPDLRKQFGETIRAQQKGGRVAERIEQRKKALDDPKNPVVSFIGQTPRKAVDAIFAAQVPARAAREIVKQAKKDASGKALAGVKAAFSDKLIADSLRQMGDTKTVVGQKMADSLDDRETAAALAQVFSPDELRRLKVIRDTALKMDAARKTQPDIGAVSGAKPNQMVEFAVRIAAANHGVGFGQGAASLQTAQMASGAAKKFLGKLTNNKAEQMLIDAIEDPELFRALLIEPQRIQTKPEYRQKIAPYITGAITGVNSETQEEAE